MASSTRDSRRIRQRSGNDSVNSLNAKIEKIKHMSHGYRIKTLLATAIHFHCGDLDMSF